MIINRYKAFKFITIDEFEIIYKDNNGDIDKKHI